MKNVDLADEIYRELEGQSDISLPTIAFWLLSSVGKLNLLLDIEVQVENSEFYPELTVEQSEIYKTMYLVNYYERQIRKNLGAAAYNSVLEVKEGGRTIRVANQNDIAKTFASQKSSMNDHLQQLIFAYKMNASAPTQVYIENPIAQSGGFGLLAVEPYEE